MLSPPFHYNNPILAISICSPLSSLHCARKMGSSHFSTHSLEKCRGRSFYLSSAEIIDFKWSSLIVWKQYFNTSYLSLINRLLANWTWNSAVATHIADVHRYGGEREGCQIQWRTKDHATSWVQKVKLIRELHKVLQNCYRNLDKIRKWMENIK